MVAPLTVKAPTGAAQIIREAYQENPDGTDLEILEAAREKIYAAVTEWRGHYGHPHTALEYEALHIACAVDAIKILQHLDQEHFKGKGQTNGNR